MYKDVISYRLAEGVTEEHLLRVASRILKDWMSKQSGFIKWEIHKNDDASYTDIVYWESKDAAKKSEADMVNVPNANDWYACYDQKSVTTKHLHKISEFD